MKTLLSGKKFGNLTTVLLLFVLTALFTFPLIFRLNTSIAGFHDTDEPFGVIWYIWWLKYALLKGLNYDFISILSVPFGIDDTQVPSYPLWIAFSRTLALAGGEIFAFSFQILLNFFLSGLTMFFLAYHLTRRRFSAIVSGLIFAFCPYHFFHSWQHLSLSYIQWLPLYILFLLKAREEPNVKNAVFAGLALGLVASFDYYYFYFSIVATAVFVLYSLLTHYRISRHSGGKPLLGFRGIKLIFLSIGVFFLTALPSLYTVLRALLSRPKVILASRNFVRSFNDLLWQSARPLSYLLPSTEHPVLGRITKMFIGSPLYGHSFTEHNLYLGWVNIFLVFVACKFYRRRSSGIDRAGGMGERERFAFGFFVFLGLAAWWFSQPPWWKIGTLRVFMPSYFMYNLLPMFRAYCRFGIIVMLAVSVLAGMGLNLLLQKSRRGKKIFLAVLFSGLILFDFLIIPPQHVFNISSVPEVYTWIKDQPGEFIIVEYPLDYKETSGIYLFYQRIHGKLMINSPPSNTQAEKILISIRKLSEPYSHSVLKRMGVRYAIVHRNSYVQTGLVESLEELDKIGSSPGLKLIKQFPQEPAKENTAALLADFGAVDVYEIVP